MDKAKQFIFIQQILMSVCIGILILMLLTGIFSIVLTKITAAPWIINCLVLISLAIGSGIAGLICGIIRKEQGILVGLICGFIIAFVLFIFKLAFASDSFTTMSLLKFVLIILPAIIGGIAGVNKKSNKYAKI